VLIKHPQPHPFSPRGRFGEALGQRELEDLGRERVLFGVGLARHFQDPADFSQQRVDTAEGQFLVRVLPYPPLRLLGPAKPPLAQLLQKLFALGPL
jgi:hypothetical protein